jgi:hypothetical protein
VLQGTETSMLPWMCNVFAKRMISYIYSTRSPLALNDEPGARSSGDGLRGTVAVPTMTHASFSRLNVLGAVLVGHGDRRNPAYSRPAPLILNIKSSTSNVLNAHSVLNGRECSQQTQRHAIADPTHLYACSSLPPVTHCSIRLPVVTRCLFAVSISLSSVETCLGCCAWLIHSLFLSIPL